MKKTYLKPEVCVMNYETGKIITNSDALEKRLVKKLNKYNCGDKEAFIDGRKISGKS